jgi:hypothetical protein
MSAFMIEECRRSVHLPGTASLANKEKKKEKEKGKDEYKKIQSHRHVYIYKDT